MFFAPAQCFGAIAKNIDFKLVAFRARYRDCVFAIVRHERHFEMDRPIDRSVRQRISSY